MASVQDGTGMTTNQAETKELHDRERERERERKKEGKHENTLTSVE